jgi:putative glutamine amidotransferase
MIGPHPFQSVGEKYLRALRDAAEVWPVPLPSPWALQVDQWFDQVDGLFLTGSHSNIEPHRFGADVVDAGFLHDPERDEATLRLIPLALQRGLPVLAVCRGLQEVNVALGGTLHQLVHEVEGRRDHRSPKSSDIDVNYAPAHDIEIVDGGALHRLLRERRVQVNSLHAQGVDRLAPRARLEAVAEDGQVEAFSIPDAPAFALALQWHPEHRALENPVSMKLFDAFATACRSRAAARLAPPMRAAAE